MTATVTSITGAVHTATVRHPLVTAVLIVAAHRVDLGRDWDRLVDAFGPDLDTVAGFVERAAALDAGELDHEVRGLAQAEAEVVRLRADALVSAQLIASLTLAGA